MNLARKIILSSASDVAITGIGFLGTLYFAQELGSGPLGTYALFTTVVSWFVVIDLGVNQAATKRISSGTDRGKYLSTLVIIHFAQIMVSIAVIFVFRDNIATYIGDSFVLIIVIIFLFKHVYQVTSVVVKGFQRVHIVDIVDSIDQITQVTAQVGLIIFGYHGISLIYGHLIGVIISTPILFIYGMCKIDISFSFPTEQHFRSMYDYMRFSWLTPFTTQAVSKVDITILGFFVANSAIGAYSVAWTMAMSLQIFGNAISRNIFPEVSNEDELGNTQRIQNVISEVFTFAGVFPIPGVVGALLLGEELLSIYGSGFTQAVAVLPVLASVAMIRSFNKPIKSTLNGLNRPDINFWTDVLFIGTNIILNVVLIIRLGIIGAGIATLVSMIIALLIRSIILIRLISLSFPVTEIAKQITSAIGMGFVILITEQWISPSKLTGVLALVALGACAYFIFLLILSKTVRLKLLRITKIDSEIKYSK